MQRCKGGGGGRLLAGTQAFSSSHALCSFEAAARVEPMPTPSHPRSVSPSDLEGSSAHLTTTSLASRFCARDLAVLHDHSSIATYAFRTIARPVPNSFSLASLHRVVANRTSATLRRTRHTLVHKMLQQASPILNRISPSTSICTLPSGGCQYS
jgi:hypothetical protein